MGYIPFHFLYFARKIYMILLVAGIVLSLMGSLPPGLISLSVAQTAIVRGFKPAMFLALGAAFAEFFQAIGAVVFAAWFLENPFAAKAFQLLAIPIFLGIAVYLWFFAKPPETPTATLYRTPAKQVKRGIVVSFFNLLAIPYWVAYAGWLQLNGWWQAGWQSNILFALGVTIGTLMALGLYAWLANELTRRSEIVARVANRVVAVIFLALALKLIIGFL
jgi:threonine/homoserine/homoserine lactone efflux protein